MAIKISDLSAAAKAKLRAKNKLAGRTPSKFNVSRAGLGQFGSRAEARRYAALEQAERAGCIADLCNHVLFHVEPFGCDPIKYHPDAVYRDIDGVMSGKPGLTCEEFKPRGWRKLRGMADAGLRMKLFRCKYPTYRMIVVTEHHGQYDIQEFSNDRTRA